MKKSVLFTIGHSTRTPEQFIELLAENGITAIADVRSQPYSRVMPHFNRESLRLLLNENGIAYVFLGNELGARRGERSVYVNGQAKYDLIAKTTAFQLGVHRVREGMKRYVIGLMCAEKDPMSCHRAILVARVFRVECDIRHVISRGCIELHSEVEERLLRKWNLRGPDLFASPDECLDQAYQKQADEIAYIDEELAIVAKENLSHD